MKKEVILWGLELEGYGAQDPSLPCGWELHRDMSIDPNYRDQWTGTTYELVTTPARKWEGNSLRQLKKELSGIGKWDPKVNETCGFHIHLSLASWGEIIPQEAKDLLVSRFRRDQEFLYRLNGGAAKERWDNGYCQPLVDGEEYEELFRYQELAMARPWSGVEFRLFAGTFDPVDVSNTLEVVVLWFEAALSEVEFIVPAHLDQWVNEKLMASVVRWPSDVWFPVPDITPRPRIGDIFEFPDFGE